ncbi:sensor histidine kinase [Peptoniphilus indolicus]|uniref:histidine kinase n=2 Tax=Peptoniphilus indolicus TaxID=33030 RepID=A0A379DCT2_9FIRM|nr:sensor histidine kinase [Peptoniphilus indolicus]SUB75796.1 Sensor histidine kinase desK [Peptoniphilus indolicus]
MKKTFKYNLYINIILHFMIGIEVINRTKAHGHNLKIFLSIFLFLSINNYLRVNNYFKNKVSLIISILIYLILGSFIVYKIGGYTDILYFMIIYETVLFGSDKEALYITLTSLMVIFISSLARKVNLSTSFIKLNFQDYILDVSMLMIYLIFFCLLVYSYKIVVFERLRIKNLNIELEKAYGEILEINKKVKELTLFEERNRIAGEIHDFLGHNLVALNMNLDVANKVVDKDINMCKVLLKKSKYLAEKSMDSLRDAVYALNEDDSKSLKDKINELVEEINSTRILELNIAYVGDLNEIDRYKQSLVYRIIKESISNSIKHGQSSKINIFIRIKDGIRIEIIDDGKGCNFIFKGNGLKGIEDNVNKLNGNIVYRAKIDEGFQIFIDFYNE